MPATVTVSGWPGPSSPPGAGPDRTEHASSSPGRRPSYTNWPGCCCGGPGGAWAARPAPMQIIFKLLRARPPANYFQVAARPGARAVLVRAWSPGRLPTPSQTRPRGALRRAFRAKRRDITVAIGPLGRKLSPRGGRPDSIYASIWGDSAPVLKGCEFGSCSVRRGGFTGKDTIPRWNRFGWQSQEIVFVGT